MGETPNRYGAHSREQEQWVLNGELHSGTPATQRQGEASASSHPTSSAGQMPKPEAANRESNAGFGGTNGSSPDFGAEPSQSPSFSQPQRKFPVPPGYGGMSLGIPPRKCPDLAGRGIWRRAAFLA